MGGRLGVLRSEPNSLAEGHLWPLPLPLPADGRGRRPAHGRRIVAAWPPLTRPKVRRDNVVEGGRSGAGDLARSRPCGEGVDSRREEGTSTVAIPTSQHSQRQQLRVINSASFSAFSKTERLDLKYLVFRGTSQSSGTSFVVAGSRLSYIVDFAFPPR